MIVAAIEWLLLALGCYLHKAIGVNRTQLIVIKRGLSEQIYLFYVTSFQIHTATILCRFIFPNNPLQDVTN